VQGSYHAGVGTTVSCGRDGLVWICCGSCTSIMIFLTTRMLSLARYNRFSTAIISEQRKIQFLASKSTLGPI
jgi:hypothetical protein